MSIKRRQVTPYGLATATLYTILGSMIVAALAVAFTHAYDLSASQLPAQDHWKNWVNAVLSELLPMASFLTLFTRWKTRRPLRFSLGVGVFALAVSGMSQLYAAGHVVPFTKEFLAVWPVIAVSLVAKLAWSEIIYGVEYRAQQEKARQAAEQAARDAARKREQEDREEVRRAARAEEQRRRTEEDRAARAADREAARELARLEADRKFELARLKLEAEQASARAAQEEAARAAAARERMAEQAALLDRQRREREAAAHDVAPGQRLVRAGSRGAFRPSAELGNGTRMSGADRAAAAQVVLNGLGDVPREEAVRAVARDQGIAARTARQLVPPAWPAVRTAVVPSRSADGSARTSKLQVVGSEAAAT